MRLADAIKYRSMEGAVAGTQATYADPRSADEWIKNWLDKKNERLNNLRVKMNTLLGPEKGEVHAAYNVYKPVISEQQPEKIASGGKWAVVDPEGLILSTWQTKREAEDAAYPIYRGLLPSATGPTGGARVKRLDAADVFTDPDLSNKTRARFLKGPKPKVVKLADWLRLGDHRPSSAGGAAGTGGAGGV